MSDFLQSWIKDAVRKVANKVLTSNDSEIKTEELLKSVRQEENNRVQISQFIKCPTEENPFNKCLLIVNDKTHIIAAVFSTKALNKFKTLEPDIPLTSISGSFIVLKKYYFTYDKSIEKLQLHIDDFMYTALGGAKVYTGEFESINEIPSTKTFISVLNTRIEEEKKNDEVYHYGWKDISKICDEDCDISSEDRNILDNLPGWSNTDLPSNPIEEFKEFNNDNIINQNDSLFNSQSIFEIVDFKPDNEIDESDNQNENNKKSEKRYRDVINDDMNLSGNEMNIENQYNSKRMKSNDYEEINQPLLFTQQVESIPNQDINMETISNFSDHLSSGTDDILTSNFAPAGNYSNHSDRSGISGNDEFEFDKETILSNPYITNEDQNTISFNTERLIEKANFYSQFNQYNDNSDEIIYESENLDNTDSPGFINNESWDTLNSFNLNSNQISSNNSNNINDNMISDDYQYMWE